MNRRIIPIGTTLVIAALLGPAPGRSDEHTGWREAAVWDDGNAEFCAYEVSWPRYGQVYEGRALLIAVKEPWAPDLDVKADRPRADGFEVIKLNHVRDVPTGIYTYHQMASAFVRRDSGELEKLAATSSEGCGISTAMMVDGRLTTSSYFDGQGQRQQPFPAGAIADDALPLALRDFLSGALPASVSVFPTLMAGRFAPLEPAELAISRLRGVDVSVPAGGFSATAIRLDGPGGGTFYFDTRAPHPLVKLEREDGTTYELAKCERIPYWSMAGPGGERWLPESVR